MMNEWENVYYILLVLILFYKENKKMASEQKCQHNFVGGEI